MGCGRVQPCPGCGLSGDRRAPPFPPLVVQPASSPQLGRGPGVPMASEGWGEKESGERRRKMMKSNLALK